MGFAACRQCNVPRTLDEIADASRVSRKEIGRTYRFIARELKPKLMPTSPVEYIPRFGSESDRAVGADRIGSRMRHPLQVGEAMAAPNASDGATRWAQALALVAVPITFGAAGALRIAVEGGTPTEEASIEAVAADLGLWTVASYLAILASILMLPFALGLLRFAPPGRGRLAALVGTALVHLGAMGFAGYNTLNFTVLSASARHADRGEAVRVLATVEEALEGSVLLTMFLTGIIFGFVVLAVGLLRARILPRWSPVALLVAVALFTFGSGSAWVTAASGAAMLVASAPAALWLTRAGGSIPAHAAAGAPR